MILEAAAWFASHLIRVRVCHGEGGCKPYDSNGNLVMNIHVDSRFALAFLIALTAFVKIGKIVARIYS